MLLSERHDRGMASEIISECRATSFRIRERYHSGTVSDFRPESALWLVVILSRAMVGPSGVTRVTEGVTEASTRTSGSMSISLRHSASTPVMICALLVLSAADGADVPLAGNAE